VQHGKGFSGCSTCGQSPCGCHGKGHHQKSLHLGFHRRHFAGKGCSKGHGPGCGCDAPAYGKGMKPHFRFGHIGRRHHCDTCGKSAGFGFGKGGCDCGSSDMFKGGWGHEGTVIWDKGHTIEAPQHGHPTPSYDPPVDLEIPAAPPTEALPVPSTPTGHSASIRRVPPVTGYRY